MKFSDKKNKEIETKIKKSLDGFVSKILNDLGTSRVEKIDERTGYPVDRYGRLLDPYYPETGEKIPGWDVPGAELCNLTNPYARLHFAVGNSDDFWCFDYVVITGLKDLAQYLVIDATINSETGGFIENGGYAIISFADYNYDALGYIDSALEWMKINDQKHGRSGWGQDPWFFARSVHLSYMDACGLSAPSQVTERQKRFGDKQINKLCGIE